MKKTTTASTTSALTTTRQPRELHLKFDLLRQEAVAELLTTLRTALRRFDDIEALERLMNQQDARLIEQQTAARANGRAPQGRTGLGRPAGQRDRGPRLRDLAALLDDAVRIIRRHPKGLTTTELADAMAEAGLFPADQSPFTHMKNAVNLARLAELKGLVHRTPLGHRMPFLVTAIPTPRVTRTEPEVPAVPETVPKTKTNTRAKARTKTKTRAPVRGRAATGRAAPGLQTRLREAIPRVLLGRPDGMTSLQITQELVSRGFEFGPVDRPNNNVNWALAVLREHGVVKSRGAGMARTNRLAKPNEPPPESP